MQYGEERPRLQSRSIHGGGSYKFCTVAMNEKNPKQILLDDFDGDRCSDVFGVAFSVEMIATMLP